MRLAVVDIERCVDCQSCMFACARRQNEAGLSSSCIGVKSVGGMERGFIVVVCRACDDPPCLKVCPTDALKPKKGGGVLLDACLKTGVDAPFPIDGYTRRRGRGLDRSYVFPGNVPYSDACLAGHVQTVLSVDGYAQGRGDPRIEAAGVLQEEGERFLFTAGGAGVSGGGLRFGGREPPPSKEKRGRLPTPAEKPLP